VIITGALVLLAWIPLRQRPGFGTVSNVFVIGIAVDAALAVLPHAGSTPVAIAMLLAGVGLIVSEFLTYREIVAVTVVPEGGITKGGEHHGYALGLIGLVSLPMSYGAVIGGSRPAAAALAVLGAFLVHSGADWGWELPAVTIPALLAAGAGLRAPRRPAPLVVAPLALVLGLAAGLHGIGAALLENGVETEARARLVARLLPWDARPWAAVGDRRRACAADGKDPVIAALPPSNGGCRAGP